MKKLLTIFLICLSVSGFAQTQINGATQIRDASIPPVKMTSAVGRPVNGGVLPSPALAFGPDVWEKYTITVSSDVVLSLGSSTADSRMTITATGDGTHTLTWPVTWDITGTFDPSFVNILELTYNGTYVYGTIRQLAENIEVTLTLAEVLESSMNTIDLTFSNVVIITLEGWSVESSGDPVTILGVSGSETAVAVFSLSRDILAGETLTISYDPATGSTTSFTGNEIETITDQAVTVPAAPGGDPCPGCTIYVDDDAVDDTAAGTVGDPFKTATAANAAATSGDVIGFRAGTYRETIVAKTNVTYRAYTGEDAYISGFEVIANTGWTVHSGNIYKKTITLPVNGFNTSTGRVQAADPHYPGNTIFANQILRDGVMMHEARWPNIAVVGTYGTDELFMRSKYRNGINSGNGFNVTSLTDATFPIAAPGLVGATLVSNGWFAQDPRTITAHSGNVVSYSAIWDNSTSGNWFRWRYYLTGKLALLDAASEWHYESGTLYFWQPGGGTPSGTIVYKARNYGIDARGKQNVTVIGLKFIGCNAFMSDYSSTGATLDRIEEVFGNHFVRHDVIEWQGVGMVKQFGIKLIGANSVIKNSIIGYSAGTAVWIGEGCRAENNLIHDVGYAGNWGNGISLWGTTGNQLITRNTIYRTGRSGFDFGYNFGYPTGSTTNHTSYSYNVEISYNDISYACLISSDGGGSYTWGQRDLLGLKYHHNWIHDIQVREQPDGGLNGGMYFDQATGQGKIYNNVLWNCADADIYHETTNDWRPIPQHPGYPPYFHPDTRLDIYNNTFASTTGGLFSYLSYITSTLDIQRNNIYRRQQSVGAYLGGGTGNTANSVFYTTDPLFAGGSIATPAAYFQLQSGSPARNLGINNYAGANGTIANAHLDAGAYPYNSPTDAFIPGYIAPEEEVSGEGSIDDASVSLDYDGSWTLYQNQAWTGSYFQNTFHVSQDPVAVVTASFTGDHIEYWAEKRNNHGIVEVRVNGVRQDCDAVTGGTQDCDLYDSSTDNLPAKIFEKDLTQGNHTISVHATDTRNASAVAPLDQVILDRFFFESNP